MDGLENDVDDVLAGMLDGMDGGKTKKRRESVRLLYPNAKPRHPAIPSNWQWVTSLASRTCSSPSQEPTAPQSLTTAMTRNRQWNGKGEGRNKKRGSRQLHLHFHVPLNNIKLHR